jgi:hypothetical protein
MSTASGASSSHCLAAQSSLGRSRRRTAAGDAGDRPGTICVRRVVTAFVGWRAGRNQVRGIMSAAALCMLITSPAGAVGPDECKQQRALFPKEWNDVSTEKPLFSCRSHYSGRLQVTLGAADDQVRRLMSVVPLKWNEDDAKQDTSKEVFRIWLDKDQVQRLQEGKYFATIVRRENSCWIRGRLFDPVKEDEDLVFFLDAANPESDSADTGSFYNKAPRISAFLGDAFDCEAIK